MNTGFVAILSQHSATLKQRQFLFALIFPQCTAESSCFASVKLPDRNRHFAINTSRRITSVHIIYSPLLFSFLQTLSFYDVSANIHSFHHRHGWFRISKTKLDSTHEAVSVPSGNEEIWLCLAGHKIFDNLWTRGKHLASSDYERISAN